MKKIKKIKNKQIWINTLCILLFFCIVLADFNGATLHNIKGEELEQYFLQSLSVNDDSQKDSVIKKQKYKNSITLLYQYDKENLVAATYIKSIYQDKWKEVFRITNQDKHMQDGVYHTVINDHIYIYAATYYIENGNFWVSFSDTTKPEALQNKVMDWILRFCGVAIGITIASWFRIMKRR